MATILKRVFAAIFSVCALGAASAGAAESNGPRQERRIFVAVQAPVSIEEAWRMWTTREGLESFFGRQAQIDPRVEGNFSIYFYPDQPPGFRGAENMRILAFEPVRRLSFTWDAPPELAYARVQRAVVTVRFEEISDGWTRVSLTHDHFGEGPEWDKTIDYFAHAWSHQVMPYFLHVAENGAVKWGDMKVTPIEAIVTR